MTFIPHLDNDDFYDGMNEVMRDLAKEPAPVMPCIATLLSTPLRFHQWTDTYVDTAGHVRTRTRWGPKPPTDETAEAAEVDEQTPEELTYSVAAAAEVLPPLIPEKTAKAAQHQDNIADYGYVSAEYFALVHKAIDKSKARKIPRASAAIDKEFSKLCARNFVDWSVVREHSDLREEATIKKIERHFGELMTLCHEKHAERNLPDEKKEFKGRIVFRGDNVKDESGYLAISPNKEPVQVDWKLQK